MSNKFTVIFTGTNDAARAHEAWVIFRKRKKNDPSDPPKLENPAHPDGIQMLKTISAPATFSYSADLGNVTANHKRLVRVVAKDRNGVELAVVDAASPDRHA